MGEGEIECRRELERADESWERVETETVTKARKNYFQQFNVNFTEFTKPLYNTADVRKISTDL